MIFQKLLSTYGFDSGHQFLLSLFPSFKYGVQQMSITLSIVSGCIANFLGLTPALVVAMFMAVVVETVSGLKASKKRGEPFESFKFSRCIIKVFVWVTLIYILHSFAIEMVSGESAIHTLGYYVFTVMKVVTMVYFCVEYATSILENLAVIDGKPKDTLVNSMWNMFGKIRDQLTDMFNRNKTDNDGNSME